MEFPPSLDWPQPLVLGPEHTGRVSSVGSVQLPDDRTLIISGSDDGKVRRWDATTGQPIGDPLISHFDPVNSVGSVQLPDGRTLIISGAGTVRRWDATTGQPIGDPLTGHTAPVNSVTSTRLPDGRTLIISGSDDGTLRRWDATTGQPISDPLTGHTAPVNSVTSTRLPDGRTLIISGSDDGTLRRWDATTGQPIGDPLTGHTAPVNSVGSVQLPDGRTLIISGSDDGTLRRWDATTGQPIGDPLTGHTAPVNSVGSVQLPDGRTLIISGSKDGTLVLRPLLETGQVGPERTGSLGTQGIGRTDEIDDRGFVDVLGRGVLAAHLEELLAQLVSANRASTAVIHIDGQWGAGKTRLVTLLERRMANTGAGDGTRLRQPVLVRYDAWRESTVAPEWWSLGAAINRAVRRERALAARAAMAVASAVSRTVRSLPVVLAVGVLAAVLVARRLNWWTGDVASLGTTMTVLTSVAALGLGAGRVLFWSAPAVGRISLRSDGNPLGEVATVVAGLRRWSPRRGLADRFADTSLAIGVLASVAWAAAVFRSVPEFGLEATVVGEWLAHRTVPLVAAMVVATLVGGTLMGSVRAQPGSDRRSGSPPGGERARLPRRRVRFLLRHIDGTMAASRRLGQWAARTAHRAGGEVAGQPIGPEGPAGHGVRFSPAATMTLLALGSGFLCYLGFRQGLPARWWPEVHRHPYLWGLAPIGLVVTGFVVRTAARAAVPRRPLLLVVDDVDRCPADRVVKLLETVHTLLRERPEVTLFPRWRSAAPFVVLILGDGRWIRRAFEISFDSFQTLGCDVHGLGADFLQKLFDHVVLVPALASDQVQTWVDDVTAVSPWVIAGRHRNDQPPVAPPDVKPPPNGHPAIETTRDAENAIYQALPSRALGPDIQDAIRRAPPTDRLRLAEVAAGKAASKQATYAFSEHLLATYTALMPANPRLVTRVANTFGMLMALRLHLGHQEPDDYVARAAIALVRFPALIDQLLSAPEPPGIEPRAEPHGTTATPPSPWHRDDVQAVLRDDQRQLIDITRLARCFGREYAERARPMPPDRTADGQAQPSGS